MSGNQHAHGHRKRLRERLLKAGHSLAEYEVLELLLGHVVTRRDTKPLAKELVKRFGSIRGALDARPEELTSVPGFGPALAAYWRLLREMMARYAEAPARKRITLCTPEAVAAFARVRLAGLSHEEFWTAFLDTQNNLIEWEMGARGTVHAVAVFAREIIERALALRASSLILVHNHPGGNASPSGPDIAITNQVREAGKSMSIRVTDHVVVTDGDCYSLAEDRIILPGE